MFSIPNLYSGTLIFGGNCISFTPWVPLLYKDQKYLPHERRLQLEYKIKDIAQKLGVNRELILIETNCHTMINDAFAFGNNLLPTPAGIVLKTDCEFDEDFTEAEFIIAHEISHIKNSDLFYMPIFGIIVSVVCVLTVSVFFPITGESSLIPDFAVSLGIILSIIPICWNARRCERNADRDGFLVCSKKGQNAGIKFFEKMLNKGFQIYHMETSGCNQLLRKCFFNEKGDCRLNMTHPSHSDRISHMLSLQKKFEDIV